MAGNELENIISFIQIIQESRDKSMQRGIPMD